MSSGEDTPTRRLMQMGETPAFVPNRFREALVHISEDALDGNDNGKLGQWLYEHRDRLQR